VEGWIRKPNLVKPNDDPIQAMACINAARKYALIFMMNTYLKGYSHWFMGKNNVADVLSRD
jgi:hypothetical protein